MGIPSISNATIFSSAFATVEIVMDLLAPVHEQFPAADSVGKRQALGGVESFALVLLEQRPHNVYIFCHVTSPV